MSDTNLDIFKDDICNIWWNNCVAGMAIVSLEGKFLKVNPSLTRILKYTENELEGMFFQDITHQSDLKFNLAEVKSLISDHKDSYEMTKRYITKLDEIIWVKIVVFSIKKEGKLQYFLVQVIPQQLCKQLYQPNVERALKSADSSLWTLIVALLKDNWKLVSAILIGTLSYIANLFIQN